MPTCGSSPPVSLTHSERSGDEKSTYIPSITSSRGVGLGLLLPNPIMLPRGLPNPNGLPDLLPSYPPAFGDAVPGM